MINQNGCIYTSFYNLVGFKQVYSSLKVPIGMLKQFRTAEQRYCLFDTLLKLANGKFQVSIDPTIQNYFSEIKPETNNPVCPIDNRFNTSTRCATNKKNLTEVVALLQTHPRSFHPSSEIRKSLTIHIQPI